MKYFAANSVSNTGKLALEYLISGSRVNRLIWRLIPVVLFSWFSVSVNADVMENFYDVEVVVEDTSNEQLQRASGLALQQMLIRVSGTEKVLQNPSLQQTLSRASKYIGQYGFDNREDGSIIAKFNFSPLTLERLLSDAGEAVWPADRPTILLWLVVEENNERRVVSRDDDLFKAATVTAIERGLKVKSPLYDLTDRLTVSADDLWSFDKAKISKASERYDDNVVLLARAWQDSRQTWHINWDSYRTQRLLAGNDRCADFSLCLSDPLSSLAERWSDRYGVVLASSEQNSLNVKVSGLSFDDYSLLSKYWRELPSVASLAVEAVIDGDYLFKIQLLSDESAFKDLMALNKNLVAQESLQADWHYRWVN